MKLSKVLKLATILFAFSFSISTVNANPFGSKHVEDENLTITKSGAIKLCEGFCNPAKLNNPKSIKNGSTTVSGFPGSENEKVFRFANEVGKGCLPGIDYDCKKSSIKLLKRRTEVTLFNSEIGEGGSGIYKWKMYIPKSVKMTGNDFHRPVQIHGDAPAPAENDQWAIAIGERRNLIMYSKGIFSEWDRPVSKDPNKIKTVLIARHGTYQGKWLNFELHIKYSIDEDKGSFALIVDGKTIYECDPCKTMIGDDDVYKGWDTKKARYHIGFGAHSQKTFRAKKWDEDNILDYEDFVVFFKDIEVGKVNKDGSIKPVYN